MFAFMYVSLFKWNDIFLYEFVLVFGTVLQIAISVDFNVKNTENKELSQPKAKVKVVVLC